jgi:hypothetical protein
LSHPFRSTLPTPPSGNTQTFYNYLSDKAGLISGNPTYNFGAYDMANKLPYTENWSLDMQWQIDPTTSFTIGYVGNRGRHGVIPIPFNQPGIATTLTPLTARLIPTAHRPSTLVLIRSRRRHTAPTTAVTLISAPLP